MKHIERFNNEYCFLKAIALAVIIFFFSSQNVFAQTRVSVLPELPAIYKMREASATPQKKAELDSQRKVIKEKGLRFNVGVTSVSQVNLYVISKEIQPYKKSPSQLSKEGLQALRSKMFGTPTGSSYDPRILGNITPIKDMEKERGIQNKDEWFRYQHIYAAVAAYEASFIRINGSSYKNINCSEGNVRKCFPEITGGNQPSWIFNLMVEAKKNLAKENEFNEAISSGCPDNPPATNYFATDWGFILPDGGDSQFSKTPSASEMKETICKYGAIVCFLNHSGAFYNYTNGIFDAADHYWGWSFGKNTSVVIIGWDDAKSAWLVKCPWGTNWGEDGYAWVGYNNRFTGAAWILAKKIPEQISNRTDSRQ